MAGPPRRPSASRSAAGSTCRRRGNRHERASASESSALHAATQPERQRGEGAGMSATYLADAAVPLDPDGSVGSLMADDPVWLMLIKCVMMFVLLLLLTLFMIWFERRVVGRMQHRPGPNRNGPFGLLQSLADALKLIFKEGIMPFKADKFVYVAAPVMAAIPAFLVFTIIPIGGPVVMFGEETALQVADVPVGVLAALAFASIGIYGIVL